MCVWTASWTRCYLCSSLHRTILAVPRFPLGPRSILDRIQVLLSVNLKPLPRGITHRPLLTERLPPIRRHFVFCFRRYAWLFLISVGLPAIPWDRGKWWWHTIMKRCSSAAFSMKRLVLVSTTTTCTCQVDERECGVQAETTTLIELQVHGGCWEMTAVQH